MGYFDSIWNFAVDQITNNQLSQAAVLATVASSVGLFVWAYCRSIPIFLLGRLDRLVRYSVTIEQETTLHRYFDLWIQAHIPTKLRRVEATYHNDTVHLTHENDFVILWRNGRRLVVSKRKEKLESATSSYNMFSRTYHITGLFAKSAIQGLIKEVIEYGKEYDRSRILRKTAPDVFISDEWGEWGKAEGTGKPFSSVYMADKQLLIDDLDKFKSREQSYKDLGVAYKRGYLLHGEPGNGKSTLAYAIADYMNYDVYALDLSGMSSNNFLKALKYLPRYSVLVIEDIDSFYKGREQVGENKIAFSTLLNTLSGVAQKNHIITVITTNHIESIDPALRRDGRCDVVLELVSPTRDYVEQFLSKVFNQDISLPDYTPTPFSKVQGIAFRNLDNLDECIKQLSNYVEEEEYLVPDLYSITADREVTYVTSKEINRARVAS